MKKNIFCLLLCATLLLTGCNGKSTITAKGVYELFSESVPFPDCEIYSYHPELSHTVLFEKLYFQNQVDTTFFSSIDDYFICLYKGNELWEVHIFKTVSLYENEKIEELLLNRRDMLQASENEAYYSDESKKRVLEARVIVVKNLVVLAVTDNNLTIESILEKI